MHPLLRQHQLSHAAIIKGHQGIRQDRQLIQRFLGLMTPTTSLKRKRHRGEDHHKSSRLPRQTHQDRSRPGSSSASKPHAKKNNLTIPQGIANLILSLQNGFFP